eukprot:TRINITY_DN7021_c0_g1_i2.p1 TRINITY_DN7021_c0_g1~~TRINITY_DN7021_c0_g1_i2.p1  ORF type:complete len:427 (+),score=88.47 TRINITY_DN7021_c0_g1_i2:45-1325(+)
MAFILGPVAINLVLSSARSQETGGKYSQAVDAINSLNQMVIALEQHLINRLEEDPRTVESKGALIELIKEDIIEAKALINQLVSFYSHFFREFKKNRGGIENDNPNNLPSSERFIRDDNVAHALKPDEQVVLISELKDKLMFHLISLTYMMANDIVGEEGVRVEDKWDQEQELVEKLTSSDGIVVKNRKFRLKTYKDCFVGTEAVDFLVNNQLATSRLEAVNIMNELMGNGLLIHVTNDHIFKDQGYFYRWTLEEDVLVDVLSPQKIGTRIIEEYEGDTIQWFESAIQSQPLTFVITYRGFWCPFCKSYMKSWNRFLSEIKELGGIMYGLTSQTQYEADQARSRWGLEYDVIGDPNNTLARTMNVHISSKSDYPEGMAQSSVTVVNERNEVIYTWKSIPTISNLGGATNRPSPQIVLKTLRKKLRS